MLPSDWLLWGEALIEREPKFLIPLSWAFQWISWIRNWLYDHKKLPIHRVDTTVVSVGNIVAGGTGKTPFVHFLAKRFSHRKVAILSRGYGAFPDEAALLQRRLPEVKVYVGKDRVALARHATLEGAELLILDDGFQHRRLHRDFDIVLLDKTDPFGKGRFLPRGYLRDSPERLSQADAVFYPQPPKVTRILNQQEEPIPSIQGWKVAIFSGISKPKRFKKTIIDLGAKVVAEWILADHQAAPVHELREICNSLYIRALICTEKDFVKLPKDLILPVPLLFLEIESEPDPEWEKVVEKIDQKIENGSHYAR